MLTLTISLNLLLLPSFLGKSEGKSKDEGVKVWARVNITMLARIRAGEIIVLTITCPYLDRFECS
jgi:hypothetical protein